jgi:thiamine-phosphate pyrophosphorylase
LHIGQDADARAARRMLGEGVALGVSVETSRQTVDAAAAGADYVAVTVWATPTKPEAVPRGLQVVRDLAGSAWLPVVGIGGIDASNAAMVLAAGAAGVAVVSAVAAASDPVAATRALAEVVRTFPGR